MLIEILFVVLLLQTTSREYENGALAYALVEYAEYIIPSSQTLEGVDKSLKENVYSGISLQTPITLVKLYEAYLASQKALGKVNDAKDEVVDTANDAKEGAEGVGKKVGKVFG